MFWDLEEESKPFTDVNYNPELFYNLKLKSKFINNGDANAVAMEIGEHEVLPVVQEVPVSRLKVSRQLALIQRQGQRLSPAAQNFRSQLLSSA